MRHKSGGKSSHPTGDEGDHVSPPPDESKQEQCWGPNILGDAFKEGVELIPKLRVMTQAFGDATLPFLAQQDLSRPAFL